MAKRARDKRIKDERKSDGTVRYRVVVSVTVNGKPTQKKARFDTVTEAEQFIRQVESDATRGVLPTGGNPTFDKVADDFLASKRATLRPGTYADYTSALRPYRRAFGGRRVASITMADVEAVRDELVQSGRARRTVSHSLGVLRQVFDRAMVEGQVAMNVAKLVKASGKPPGEAEAFTPDEVVRIVDEIRGHQWEHGYLLSMHGLRRSEVMALQWSDVDLAAGTVTVSKSRTITKSGGGTHVGPPKTANGHRVVPLDSDDVAVLAAARRRQMRIQGPMLIDEFGRELHPDRYSDEWVLICKRAKVRPLDMRAARRAAVTNLRDAGVLDHVVAERMGHDEAVMRRHYSVAHEEQQRAAGAVASGLLRRRRSS